MFPRLLMMFAALTATATGTAAEPTLAPDVLAGLKRVVEAGDARAISIGLYDHGNVRVLGFGELSRMDDSVPQGDTLFEIGSITKVFTSLLVQTQVDAGRLAWDDTIASRLPDVKFASDTIAAITLRELSTHTSGLPRMPDNFEPQDSMNPYEGYDRTKLLAFVESYDPDSKAKEYAYSNLGVGLLGVIAADAAGADFGAAMLRDVILPLGMPDTDVLTRPKDAARLAQGFSGGADMENWDGFDAFAGAGALVSTSNDLLTFIRQNLEPQVLGDSLARVREQQGSGETALGWHISDVGDDGPVYWHNGGTGGYASFMAYRPADATGIVILSASTEYDKITRLGFEQMSPVVAKYKVENLDLYPGAYKINSGMVLSVSIDGGQLFAQATGQAAFPLTAVAENEFVFPTAGIRIVFAINDDGQAEKLTLYQAGQVLPAPRTGDAEIVSARVQIEVSEAELNDFVGEYELAPKVLIAVTVRNGRLFARLTGQAAFPVFAYEPDKFFYKVVNAQLHFERNDNSVVAVVLHQNGQQRAPRLERD